jgi:hypothetical protein
MVLTSPFRNAHRSWHTVLIGQILVYSVIYTFAQETVVRATCLCLAGVLFLALHMTFKPFASEFMNLMQTFLLFSLSIIAAINIPSGTVISVATDKGYSDTFKEALSWLQIVLLLLPLPVLIVSIIVRARTPHAAVWKATDPVRKSNANSPSNESNAQSAISRQSPNSEEPEQRELPLSAAVSLQNRPLESELFASSPNRETMAIELGHIDGQPIIASNPNQENPVLPEFAAPIPEENANNSEQKADGAV